MDFDNTTSSPGPGGTSSTGTARTRKRPSAGVARTLRDKNRELAAKNTTLQAEVERLTGLLIAIRQIACAEQGESRSQCDSSPPDISTDTDASTPPRPSRRGLYRQGAFYGAESCPPPRSPVLAGSPFAPSMPTSSTMSIASRNSLVLDGNIQPSHDAVGRRAAAARNPGSSASLTRGKRRRD
ncbi:hypothetical protein PLICRDRAFT_176782 [Plicaturopsis crispa FD-325 SS-3]|nr:hypothetical protein PLICRDRAFT_176782 [Plicaturopsis crispa FD-325 SS-3]